MRPRSGVTKSFSQGKTFIKLALPCCSPATLVMQERKKQTSLNVILRIYA